MYNAVVFDAFGTLIKFGSGRRNPYRHFLCPTDLEPLSRRPFLTRNTPIETFAEELGLHDLIPLLHTELQQEIGGLSLFEEVEDVLSKLKRNDTKIAICSNLAAEYGYVVRRLLPDVDAYIFSFEVGAVKPEPAIFQAACNALSSTPQDTLFIGDSRRCDYDGPRNFGMDAKLLNRKEGDTLNFVLDL